MRYARADEDSRKKSIDLHRFGELPLVDDKAKQLHATGGFPSKKAQLAKLFDR